MNDPTRKLNPSPELMRQRLADQAQSVQRPAHGVSARAGSWPTEQADRSGTLKQRLRGRLAAVDAADPQRDRKRRRVFIESVLASELGEALQNDPKALELVERIEEAIREHPELERQFRAVLSNYAGN